MLTQVFLVDAFTDRPFTGNPASVCLLLEPSSGEWMQSLAKELNFTETAFVLQQRDGFLLRWFTPIVEVDTCGHGTLASAHVLWETGVLAASQEARFHTRAGLLRARKTGEWIELSFPSEPDVPADPPADLAKALGVVPVYFGKNRYDYLVEVGSEDDVRHMRPELGLLATFPTEGVIVTSRSLSPAFDFVSRYFAPKIGIDEDPVCGAAHCCLGPYWGRRLGKSALTAYQASPRGGIIRVRLEENTTFLIGQAVTVLRGELSEMGSRVRQ